MKTKERIFKAIQDFVEDYGYPPSIRELAKKVGLKSTKAIKVHLDNLAKERLIEKIAGQARSIRIKPKQIPIVGRIAAGLPELAFEEVEGYFNPTQWRDCFLLKVRGDSMINAHIYEGDLVVVKPTQEALNNDIVVANIEGETTVKRLKKIGSAFVLKPENDAYTIIKAQFAIIGKVIGVRRDSRVLEVGDVARGLKALAKDLQCTVLALCQLNRRVEGSDEKEPRLDDLRESGEIEQEADSVLFLWTPERDVTQAKLPGFLSVKKNRHGPLARIQTVFDKAGRQIVAGVLV